jgi:hypothetical protein
MSLIFFDFQHDQQWVDFGSIPRSNYTTFEFIQSGWL